MKKSTAITIIVVLSALLVFSFVPRMAQYLVPESEVSDTTSVSDSTSEDNSEPTYTRVEAERYEVVVPDVISPWEYTNIIDIGSSTGTDWNSSSRNCTFTYFDSDIGDATGFKIYMYYTGPSATSVWHNVLKGEYGRYVISETQVAGEPLAFTFEPIYEYVLDSEDEGLYYERVEAEMYEIQFPHFVNGEFCYGGLYCGQFEMEDMPLISSFISLDDADCIVNEIFYLVLYVYLDGSTMIERTLDLEVEQGDYGRYVISETQVADEPVAYTLEPIYEYVLVE